MRTCVGCRRRFPLAEGRLVRVARASDGSVQVGRTLAGRGAWLCGHDRACLELALKRKAFGRALRVDLAPEDLEALRAHFFPPKLRDDSLSQN